MKSLFALSLFATALVITACNTVEGVGRDIERGGEHIQGSAK